MISSGRDMVGGRRVLDQLGDVVPVDDGPGRHRQVLADHERVGVDHRWEATVVAQVVEQVAGPMSEAAAPVWAAAAGRAGLLSRKSVERRR